MKNIFNYFSAQLLLLIIKIYRLINPFFRLMTFSVFGWASECKYNPTCSEYALRVIRRDGTIHGLPKVVRRIASCHS